MNRRWKKLYTIEVDLGAKKLKSIKMTVKKRGLKWM